MSLWQNYRQRKRQTRILDSCTPWKTTLCEIDLKSALDAVLTARALPQLRLSEQFACQVCLRPCSGRCRRERRRRQDSTWSAAPIRKPAPLTTRVLPTHADIPRHAQCLYLIHIKSIYQRRDRQSEFVGSTDTKRQIQLGDGRYSRWPAARSGMSPRMNPSMYMLYSCCNAGPPPIAMRALHFRLAF